MINIFYVYRFLNKDNVVIYVGKAKSMESRMMSHLSNESVLKREYFLIEYVEFEREQDQLFYEILMINKFNPIYNTQDKFEANILINDPYEDKWKVWDKISLFTELELEELCDKYKNSEGGKKGGIQYSLLSKISHARDDMEREIRIKNYNLFAEKCGLDSYELKNGFVENNIYVFEVGKNDIRFSNDSTPKLKQGLHIKNQKNKFQINSVGKIELNIEELTLLVESIISKYDLCIN